MHSDEFWAVFLLMQDCEWPHRRPISFYISYEFLVSKAYLEWVKISCINGRKFFFIAFNGWGN